MGLPTQINTTVQGVLDRMLEGVTLRDALKEYQLEPKKFAQALQGDRNLSLAYVRAQELRSDLLVDEALTIADTEQDAARARNQIDIRKWMASRLHQKKWGDRVDLNVTQTIDIGSTLAEARARLLPVSYQQDIIDVQAIDLQGQNQAKLSDNQSLTDAAPDIFS